MFTETSSGGSGWGLTDGRELVKIFNCQLRNDAVFLKS